MVPRLQPRQCGRSAAVRHRSHSSRCGRVGAALVLGPVGGESLDARHLVRRMGRSSLPPPIRTMKSSNDSACAVEAMPTGLPTRPGFQLPDSLTGRQLARGEADDSWPGFCPTTEPMLGHHRVLVVAENRLELLRRLGCRTGPLPDDRGQEFGGIPHLFGARMRTLCRWRSVGRRIARRTALCSSFHSTPPRAGARLGQLARH